MGFFLDFLFKCSYFPRPFYEILIFYLSLVKIRIFFSTIFWLNPCILKDLLSINCIFSTIFWRNLHFIRYHSTKISFFFCNPLMKILFLRFLKENEIYFTVLWGKLSLPQSFYRKRVILEIFFIDNASFWKSFDSDCDFLTILGRKKSIFRVFWRT